jgi:AcrR family transcriptional regulator
VETADYSDAQARTLLLAGARARVAQSADFTIAALLTDCGISRTQFRRCFAGKQQLLAAITQDDVKSLGEILEVAQPMEVQQAVGSDITPAAPITDAWLERRLRVFERALSGLEKRQDKSEQSLTQRLALMEESLAGLVLRAAPQGPVPAPAPVAAPDAVVFDPAESNLLPADAPAAPQQLDLAPTVLAHVEEIAAGSPLVEPISEKEIADFIAHARQAARNAMPQEPPPKKRQRKRGLVWEAMLLSGILIGGLIMIGGVLLLASGMPQPASASAIQHRQMAQGDARILALADNGDAKAQTLLALSYLHNANDQAGLRWSQAAAAQGQPVAQYLLGTLTMARDRAQAMRWLGAAAEQGNVKAMHNLAIAYAQGPAPDPAMAVQWFSKAAALGYRDSQFDLAVLYERGMGVAQSGADALKWYLIAAASGDAPSAGRAAILKDQIGPDDVRMATAEAAGFVPKPSSRAANETPNL